jgi:hypothetical protein
LLQNRSIETTDITYLVNQRGTASAPVQSPLSCNYSGGGSLPPRYSRFASFATPLSGWLCPPQRPPPEGRRRPVGIAHPPDPPSPINFGGGLVPRWQADNYLKFSMTPICWGQTRSHSPQAIQSDAFPRLNPSPFASTFLPHYLFPIIFYLHVI